MRSHARFEQAWHLSNSSFDELPGHDLAEARASREKLVHLFIGRLGEVPVPSTDAQKWLRRRGTYDFVDLRPELFTRLGRRDRHRDDDARRLLLAQRRHRG